MPKPLKLPKHIRDMNQDVLCDRDEVNLPPRRRPVGVGTDKRHEFGYWWGLLSGAGESEHAGGWRLVEGFKFERWEFDWAFPDYRIAVEVDGGQHEQGGGRHASDGDRWKLNAAAAAGWLVFRFSPDMLTADPGRCVLLVGRCLLALEHGRVLDESRA